MPRRELLTPAQRFQLFAFPDDESELIRLATLSKEDFAFVRQHRGDHNRLGVAVLMIYLRYPGRVLGPGEKPHAPVLGIVATQLRMAPAVWDLYATRDETRREHLQELLARSGLVQFTRRHYRELFEFLLPVAMQTTQGIVLAQAAVEELRRHHVLLPPVTALEKLCATVATRAQREVHRRLTAPLTDGQRAALDQLLLPLPDRPVSRLAWLRQSPGEPSAKAALAHIERLQAIRAVGLPPDIGRSIHQNRLLRLAREGGQTAVYQIEEYETDRRHATLVAILLDTAATLTDEILNLHDRLIGSFFTKAKHKYEKRIAAEGKAVNDKVRLYAKIGAALIAAKEAGDDPFQAIEAIVSWDAFTASVREAEQLARDAEFDSTALLVDHYTQLRRYSPVFLDTFAFRAAAARQPLLDAIATLREMNRTDARKVPSDAPTTFVTPRWERFVVKDGGIDRKFYELAAMSELKNALRSGDVSVIGSRQFRNFDEYLVPRAVFDDQRRESRLGLAVETSAAAYLDERLGRLRDALDETARLAAAGELPDVELNDRGLKISPLDDATPAEADVLTQQVYDLLPRVKITDLLLEVDQWTDFTRHFTHLKSDAEQPDRTLLLTAILADALTSGSKKWLTPVRAQASRSCRGWWPGTSATRPIRKRSPNWSTISIACRSPRTGAKAPPRHPMGSAFGPVVTVRRPGFGTRNTATNRGCCSIRTFPISTRRSIRRSSIRRCATPRMCSTACCITSRSCASRSTIPTRPASPITCSRCVISSGSSSRHASRIWLTRICTCLARQATGRRCRH